MPVREAIAQLVAANLLESLPNGSAAVPHISKKRFIETLWLQAGPMMYFSLSAPDVVWDASAHEKILDGLRMKDPVAVRRAVEMDISGTAESLTHSSVFTKRKYLVPHFHLHG